MTNSDRIVKQAAREMYINNIHPNKYFAGTPKEFKAKVMAEVQQLKAARKVL